MKDVQYSFYDITRLPIVFFVQADPSWPSRRVLDLFDPPAEAFKASVKVAAESLALEGLGPARRASLRATRKREEDLATPAVPRACRHS